MRAGRSADAERPRRLYRTGALTAQVLGCGQALCEVASSRSSAWVRCFTLS